MRESVYKFGISGFTGKWSVVFFCTTLSI